MSLDKARYRCDEGSIDGIYIGNNQVLELDYNRICTINSVWELPMIGAERKGVDIAPIITSFGGENNGRSIEGVFVAGENNIMCQIQDSFGDSRGYDKARSTQFRKIRKFELNKSNNRRKENLLFLRREKLKKLDEKCEKWNKIGKYYPAPYLPEDSFLVVRTSAIKKFESTFFTEKQNTKHKSSKNKQTADSHVPDQLYYGLTKLKDRWSKLLNRPIYTEDIYQYALNDQLEIYWYSHNAIRVSLSADNETTKRISNTDTWEALLHHYISLPKDVIQILMSGRDAVLTFVDADTNIIIGAHKKIIQATSNCIVLDKNIKVLQSDNLFVKESDILEFEAQLDKVNHNEKSESPTHKPNQRPSSSEKLNSSHGEPTNVFFEQNDVVVAAAVELDDYLDCDERNKQIQIEANKIGLQRHKDNLGVHQDIINKKLYKSGNFKKKNGTPLSSSSILKNFNMEEVKTQINGVRL